MVIFGGFVYIMSNYTNTVLYVGVTSDLIIRVEEHKKKRYPDSFTAKFNCNKLVYFETYTRIEEAIAREKQLKNWKRIWKDDLINKANPYWNDLTYTLLIEDSAL
ncbi:MAG: GIY-YIG nuclease family protein [Bacteroidetes bacterium]|nr:GIY-YIG nuclease family protein [Bacteroidota bacterium]